MTSAIMAVKEKQIVPISRSLFSDPPESSSLRFGAFIIIIYPWAAEAEGRGLRY